MHSPTAVPRIPASASGVSTQRSGPKRSRSPAVARKTPPARPTFSPMTMTLASRSSSTWKQSLMASTRSFSLTEDPPQFPELLLERSRRVGERVLEDEARVGGRLGLGLDDPPPHQLLRLAANLFGELVGEDAEAAQVALVPADTLVALLLLDALEVDVRGRVVSSRVGRGAVADGLDERRPFARPRALNRLARRLVDGEHVEPVDASSRHPVAQRLVRERLRRGLRRERRRDRPAVVVAEENQRRAHHAGEVGALVERALRGRAVAEEHERAGTLATQLLPPRQPGGMRDMSPDRNADRGDVVIERVPPAGRVTPPPGEHRRGGHPAEEPDRRLPIARENPVVAPERVQRAGLHRLVVPEDRVGADPALAVVDERALVVGAEQHHAAIELDQVALVEPLDLAVGELLAVADDA